MKRLFTTFLMVATVMTIMAVPAKRGVWKTLTLADGTTVEAQLTGDEFGHCWRATDGKAYIENNEGFYVTIDTKALTARAKARRTQANVKRVMKREFGHPSTILGQKKAIVLLVDFNGTSFQEGHDLALYQKITNKENFNEGKFKGSMADYFKAQSRGKFELDFDVVGPLTVSNNASYYGKNDENGNDYYAGQMVCEAVKLAKDQVADWTPYDWDGDGIVDQVYLVYAGKGEADGGASNTIWPHAYDLASAKYYGDGTGPVEVGTNLYVNTYACGPELEGGGALSGIGTMCHEFSHCLGYPDFYDIDYKGGPGMGSWDLMDAGSYNGDGYQPAGYTSYERWFAGWETPIELKAEDISVTNMKSLQNGGEFYIIYNDKNANEYFLLENRQKEGWDASLPGAGLLILHCDFDQSIWEQNAPNDDANHQRFIVVTANGEYPYEIWRGDYYFEDAVPFPYGNVNAFNKDFKTKDKLAKNAAQFFTKTSNGTYWMDGSVENITNNGDKTVSFNYVAQYVSNDTTTVGSELFYESFDKCDGTGGNDGSWSGNITHVNNFHPDNDGWSALSDKYYGGNQCAKFGTGDINGEATTPTFTLNGEATMTFKAGAWNAKNDSETLLLDVDGGTVTPTSVEMTKGEFTEYEVTLTGSGPITVTFASLKGRFFLDEVKVFTTATDGIKSLTPALSEGNGVVYDLMGRRIANGQKPTAKGLYIINGKKVIIR